MVILAAILLFGWGALSGGFGAYAFIAASQSESLFHVVQAGIALLIATVSCSAGLLVVIVGGLKKTLLARTEQTRAVVSASEPAVSPEEVSGSRGQTG